MSSDVSSNARWYLDADASGVVAAYQKAGQAAQTADKTAQAGAAATTAAYGKLQTAVVAAGASATKSFGDSTTAANKLVSAVDLVDKKIQQAQTSVANLKAKWGQISATTVGGFNQGQGMGIGDLSSSIYAAGGLRNFAGSVGGPLALGAIGAGVAYHYADQFAGLDTAAKNARATAQEMDGLRKALGETGLAEKQVDDLAAAMAKSLEGSKTATVAGLTDTMKAIEAATSAEDKMKIATDAVGADLARALVQAADAAKGKFANLADEVNRTSSSFSNDLAKAGTKAIGVLAELGERADGTYAQLKRLLGVANNLDQLKAAGEDVKRAQNQAVDRSTAVDPLYQQMAAAAGGSATILPTGSEDDAAAAVLAAQMKLEQLRAQQGLAPSTSSLSDLAASKLAVGGARGQIEGFRPGGEQFGPNLPPGGLPVVSPDAAGGGSGSSAGAASTAAQDVVNKLNKQLELAQAIGSAHDAIVEKQKIEALQAEAGVTAESKTGQLIAQRVVAIDAANAAAKKQQEAQDAATESAKKLSTETAKIADTLVQGSIHGQKLSDTLRQVGLQLAEKGISAALQGIFGSLFSSGGSPASQAASPLAFLPAIFSGLFHDAGGPIAAGSVGIVGEFGPELVRGPASVTSRAQTAAMARSSVGGGTTSAPQIYMDFRGAAGVDALKSMVAQGMSSATMQARQMAAADQAYLRNRVA